MPRHTHPRAVAKHARAHVRFQRDRSVWRRWRQAKERHDGWCSNAPHPEVIRRERPPGQWWPFDLELGRFARNPFNLCSCDLCTAPAYERRADRRRRERAWRKSEEGEGELPGSPANCVMNKRCEVAAIESLDGAGELLGRADELLERAQSAAASAGLDALSAGCRTRRTALRRQRRAIGQLAYAHIRGELSAAAARPRRARSRHIPEYADASRMGLGLSEPD